MDRVWESACNLFGEDGLGYVVRKCRERSEELREGLWQPGLSKLGEKVGCRQSTLTGKAHAAAVLLPCAASVAALLGSSRAGHGQATRGFVRGHFQ